MKARVLFPRLIIMGFLVAWIPVSVGAQSTGTFASITVTDVLSGAPSVGSIFTTDLQVSIANQTSPETGVMGVEIWLPFDPSVVTVEDFDGKPANGVQVEVKNDFFDGSLVVGANEVIVGAMPSTAPGACAAAGACVHVAVSHTDGSGPVTNKTGTVASVAWAALAAGSPAISIAQVPPGLPPGSVLSDANGQPIPINSTSVPAITVVDAGAIVGAVRRQGTQSDLGGTEIVVLAISANDDDGGVATATVAADGSFNLAIPSGGTYTINAGYPGYLQCQKSSVYVAGTIVDVGLTELVGGDVNADNCINILDIVSIIGRFGSTGLAASSPEDINDDGTINILDLTVAAGNFTQCGPTAWGSS